MIILFFFSPEPLFIFQGSIPTVCINLISLFRNPYFTWSIKMKLSYRELLKTRTLEVFEVSICSEPLALSMTSCCPPILLQGCPCLWLSLAVVMSRSLEPGILILASRFLQAQLWFCLLSQPSSDCHVDVAEPRIPIFCFHTSQSLSLLTDLPPPNIIRGWWRRLA